MLIFTEKAFLMGIKLRVLEIKNILHYINKLFFTKGLLVTFRGISFLNKIFEKCTYLSIDIAMSEKTDAHIERTAMN